MDTALAPELYWTTLTIVLTALLWVPHILQRVIELGLVAALSDPRHDVKTQAPWAQRAIAAHTNAVENLVIFAPLAVIVSMTNMGTAMTATAAMIYFYARLAHYVIYVMALPWLRTPMFVIGFACQLVLAGTLLGLL